MAKLDTEGTFRGEVLDHTVTLTKAGKPQLYLKVRVDEVYADSAEWMEHFELNEPGWAEWPAEEASGYLLLFNATDRFDSETAQLNVTQTMSALGWDGTDFTPLASGDFAGKRVQIRVAYEEYKGKTQLRLAWLDEEGATPGGTVKHTDPDTLSDLNSRLRMARSKPAKASRGKAGAKPPRPAARPEPSPIADDGDDD